MSSQAKIWCPHLKRCPGKSFLARTCTVPYQYSRAHTRGRIQYFKYEVSISLLPNLDGRYVSKLNITISTQDRTHARKRHVAKRTHTDTRRHASPDPRRTAVPRTPSPHATLDANQPPSLPPLSTHPPPAMR